VPACLVCTCEDTMVLDKAAFPPGTRFGAQLCRAQLDRVRAALTEPGGLIIGCTQEAPLFLQEAEAAGAPPPAFVNLRETAGWSAEGAAAGPKMAALVAAASVPAPDIPLVTLESRGVTLVVGRDAVAIEAAAQLVDRLDLTVLLTGEAEVPPPRRNVFPVLRGRARGATGWLGAFAVTIDGFAAPAPSSRATLAWGPGRDGAVSRCDVILDLSGRPPLFPAHSARRGYLRADPGDATAVARAVLAASELVGEFDAPRFVAFDAGLCAHGRNKRTGCTRCLELCPTGAITPAGDSVAISAEICAGCGACAAVCPTGAATYALPPPATVLTRLRTLLFAYRAAGGADPIVLLHDAAHGEPLIDALARHGDGLPARVLPLAVNEATAIDLATLAAGLAWGAAAMRVLLQGRRGEGAPGVLRNLETLSVALRGLGLEAAAPRAAAIETDDPFALGEALAALPRTGWKPAEFLPLDAPKEVLRMALRALGDAAPDAPRIVALPALAPIGAAVVDAAGCTLCLACTMVCPTGAFTANPERPELRFTEDACVQCGLCVATCPEKVIALVPRLNLAPEALRPVTFKTEAPFPCAVCGKPFGTRASVERVKAKLTAHWMFVDPARLAVLEQCENCRVFAATEGGIDPYAGAPRPPPRTAQD